MRRSTPTIRCWNGSSFSPSSVPTWMNFSRCAAWATASWNNRHDKTQNHMCQNRANPSLPHYNNRDLSWLAFNQRVLDEALDTDNPLLERLKFFTIVSSNLDEFFEVRGVGYRFVE